MPCQRKTNNKPTKTRKETIKPRETQWADFERQIALLLESLIPCIEDDFRCTDDPDDDIAGMLVTVGATIDEDGSISWGYQTGDNSYTGGAYGHPFWGSRGISRTTMGKDAAKEIVEEIVDQTVY